MIDVLTRSAAETERLGVRIGRCLGPGQVVALSGPLGAGKTTLAKGIARGLGVRDAANVASPTFVLIHEYAGRWPVYHIDWYRLDAVSASDEALSRECLERGDSVAIVEWPERGRGLLPREALSVRLSHAGADRRRIRIRSRGDWETRFKRKK